MSYISDLNFFNMEYSHFAAPSIMPLIHPSEDDIAMGAVDYLTAPPLSSPNSSSLLNSTVSVLTVPINATTTHKVIMAIQSAVPRIVDQIVPVVASGTEHQVVEQNGHLGFEDQQYSSPVDIHVDLLPFVPTQV
jgi:hypothetical protein